MNPVGSANLEKWVAVNTARATEAVAVERFEVQKLLWGFGMSCLDLQRIFREGTQKEEGLDAKLVCRAWQTGAPSQI